MKLRHIFITFRDKFDEFEEIFNHNVEHINWYLSRKIRTINLELPYEFNTLGIRPTFSNNQHCKIIPEKSLSICYTVDENLKVNLLKSTNDKERCEIYLSLLEQGYRIACKEYDIPIDELLSIHRQFRLDNYKTEWIHKKLFIKEHQIKVVFRCSFTSYNFTFNMDLFEYANSSSTKNKKYGTEIIFEVRQKDFQTCNIGDDVIYFKLENEDSIVVSKRNERKYLLNKKGNLKFIQGYSLGKPEIHDLVFTELPIQDSLLSFIAASDSIYGQKATINIHIDSNKHTITFFSASHFGYITEINGAIQLIDPNCMQHDWLATKYKTSNIMVKATGRTAAKYINSNTLNKSLADSIIMESNKTPENWDDSIPWEAFAIWTSREYSVQEDGSIQLERAYHIGENLLE